MCYNKIVDIISFNKIKNIMKSLTGVIVGVILVVVVILGVLKYQENNESKNSGGLFIGITDASADISNVNDIDMSVRKVEVHSTTKGWVDVASNSKNYQLLSLKASGKTEFYGKTNVESGSYDKVRVTLGDTVVKTKSKGNIKAILPSNQVVMNVNTKVRNDQDSHIELDFLADKSLHSTTDGQYVFAPVIKTETRSNAKIEVKSDNEVVVSGGDVDSRVQVGVDLDGSSKSNFELNTNSNFKIESSVNGALKFMLGGKAYSSDNTEVRESESSDASLKNDIKLNSSSDNNSNSGATKIDGSLKTDVIIGN